MKQITDHKTHLLIVLTGGAIPAVLALNSFFRLSDRLAIILIVFLGLICGSMTLWAYANRHVDGSEWWQDDSASGWRGY